MSRQKAIAVLILCSLFSVLNLVAETPAFTFKDLQGKWHYQLGKDAVPSIIDFRNETSCFVTRFGSETVMYSYEITVMDKVTYIRIGDFLYVLTKGYAKNSLQLTPSFEGLGILLLKAK